MLNTDVHKRAGGPSIPVLIITGPTGVGKTSVAAACADLLERRGLSHVFVDMDALRWCFPRHADDPFHMQLGFQNLAVVWANSQAAGAARVILADIVETQAQRDAYRAAIPGAQITVVRLRASIAVIHARLAGREQGESLRWHQARAIELQEQWERAPVEDYVIDTGGREIADIACDILARIGWV